jgi:hypothetical protein
LAPAVDGVAICALADAPAVTNINVVVSIDLMTSLRSIEVAEIEHICLVGNNRLGVQQVRVNSRYCEERSDASIDGAVISRCLWIASRSLSSGGALRRPVGWQ